MEQLTLGTDLVILFWHISNQTK